MWATLPAAAADLAGREIAQLAGNVPRAAMVWPIPPRSCLIRAMAKLRASPGKTPEDRLRRASKAVAADRSAEAERLLRPLIGKRLSMEDQAALGALLGQLDHPKAAEELAKAETAIAKADPGSASDQFAAARALSLMGRNAAALDALSRCLSLDPTLAEAGMLALRLYLLQDDPDAAIAALEPVFSGLRDPRRMILNAAKALGVAGHAGPALTLLSRLQTGAEDPEVSFIAAGLEGRDADRQSAMAEAIFDGFAESYDANLAKIDNNGPAMIGTLLTSIGPGKARVLDAGCGTGLCAPILRPHARELVGCDISIPMLEQAKAKRGYDALLRSDLGAPVTLPPGPFDLIIAADVMTYFGDLTPVLQGLVGIMSPGAWLIFTVEEAQDGPPHSLSPTGRYKHTAKGVGDMLTAAGLTRPKQMHRDRLRTEFGDPVQGLALAAQKLALFG